MNEVLLGVQPVMQPKPNRNPTGDCFACALTAAMRHLYPERPPAFDEVWPWFEGEYSTGGKCLNNTWDGMRRAMGSASSRGWAVEYAADVCQPSFLPWMWSHSFHWQPPESLYSQRLEAYLRAGWVALTEVVLHGKGPVDEQYFLAMPDHFVVLDGVRETDPNHREIHVVCSVKGAYWLPEYLLLRQYGAGAWWLVRRRDA